MVRQYSFHFSFDPVPPIMRRGRHVLIVIKDITGKYVLGRKHVYPKGIVRFVGGGIEIGEDPAIGAVRELHEELGLVIPPKKVQKLAEIHVEITSKNEDIIFTTYLFFAQVGDTKFVPSGDLNGVARLTVEEVKDLIERFQRLFTKSEPLSSSGETIFWSNYSALYGEIHRIGLELTQQS